MALARPLVPNTFVGTCPVGLSLGDVVYVSGASRAVSRVDISDRAKVAAVGVIVRKTGTDCVIQTRGLVQAVYSSLTPGAVYFTDISGKPTPTRPTGSESTLRWVVEIGRALDDVTLDVNVTSITGVRS